MKIGRNITTKIHFLFDECLPPIIRDSRFFYPFLLKLLYKDKSGVFVSFKENALNLTEQKFIESYKKIQSVLVERDTDLNDKCITAILNNIKGKTVLEVGCGNCFLAKKISEKYQITATDIVVDKKLNKGYPNLKLIKSNIEKLPFEDNSFETVICAHTLEHVQNIILAIKELRRVTKKRLIIVVPKQRPYKHTFDLHLHFFPYSHSLLTIMGTKRDNSCKELDGDLFYVEDN